MNLKCKKPCANLIVYKLAVLYLRNQPRLAQNQRL